MAPFGALEGVAIRRPEMTRLHARGVEMVVDLLDAADQLDAYRIVYFFMISLVP
jgi:hypothetical protein